MGGVKMSWVVRLAAGAALAALLLGSGCKKGIIDVVNSPGIRIKFGTAVVVQDGQYDLGQVSSVPADVTCTIENVGLADLTLSGSPKVSVSGSAAFTVSQQPVSPVKPNAQTTFTVRFAPADMAQKTAVVSIPCNDTGRNPCCFSLVGQYMTNAPEMNMKRPDGSSIADGSGSYDFVPTLLGSHQDVTFTLENLGTADLNLAGNPRVAIGGADASQFVVTEQPSTPVAPASTTTFIVRFTPDSGGAKNATLSIANDDLDENPYNFTLTGFCGTTPEINVKQGATSILDGSGSFTFVSTTVGTSTDVVFDIENLGTGILNLTGSPRVVIGGPDGSQFSVAQEPSTPVASSSSTTFTLRFAPTGGGMKSATVSIANDDLDEGEYTFDISGTGQASDINVKQGTTNIPDNTGNFIFADTVLAAYADVTFTIENLGTSDLTLPGSPRVQLGGTDASQFSVTVQPDSLVAPSSSTTFIVRFKPTTHGTKSATVAVASNDPDENPYDFSIAGTSLGELKNVSASDAYYNDSFGSSVAVSADGTTLVSGAYLADGIGVPDCGAAYVFAKSGSSWLQAQKLVASVKASYDYFGMSVAASSDGSTIVVGAEGADAAYVFTKSSGVWTEAQKLTASDGQAGNQFGCSVAMSANGSIIVIGADNQPITYTGAGAAYIFSKSGSSWSQTQKLIGTNKQSCKFGCSVDVSADGNIIASGEFGYDTTGKNDVGCVYVFKKSGSSWVGDGGLSALDKVAGALFGRRVAVSPDGATIVVGAISDTIGTSAAQGSVYVFTKPAGSWGQAQKLIAPDGVANEHYGFGLAVSLNGDTVIFGPYQSTAESISPQGCAYVFKESGGTWLQACKLCAADGAGGDQFGYSLDVTPDGQTIAAGATGDDISTSGEGSVYTCEW